MKVAIVHYHLRTGGVTRVIRNALAALAGRGVECAVLAGEPPAEPSPEWECVTVLDGLGYETAPISGSAPRFADRLEMAATGALGGAPDLWHIHNHSLGKNRFLPLAVGELARRGRRMLLHVHDFAEDGRPETFLFLLEGVGGGDPGRLAERLYPCAPHVHYGALNGRDHRFLADAGVPPAQLHLLPNAVGLDEPHGGRARADDGGSRLFIYPTRAIRRKNLGEFLLWAALAEGDRFAVTRAPVNPAARPVYDRWVAFAAENGLPVDFDIAATTDVPFAALLQRATALVTTSVAEGFGLGFLEPWLVGRPLVGRDLPEITEQISSAGVDLSGLYGRLDVPLEWVGGDALRKRVAAAYGAHLAAYGRSPAPDDVGRALAAMCRRDTVDFGCLDEPFQRQVITILREDRAARDRIRPLRPGAAADPSETVRRNAEVVGREFSLARYGERLVSIYEAVLACEPSAPESLSAKTLLDHFLDPARFNLLLTH